MNLVKQRQRRKKSVRKTLQGTTSKPRLSVFRSNKYVYAQLIDDQKGLTILGVSQKEIKSEKAIKQSEMAHLVGQKLAEKAKGMKITEVIFDRGSYAYHGQIKALAEGAREGGLTF